MPSSRGSSQPRDRTQLSCIAGRFFTSWAIREAHQKKKIFFLNPHKSHWPKFQPLLISFPDITVFQEAVNWPSALQFSHSVVSDWSHRPQHTKPPCPSSTPGVYSDSCQLSQWCHPTISSSVIPFFSHFQSCPASGSFQMSQFFTSGGQSIGVSTSASVLPMNI